MANPLDAIYDAAGAEWNVHPDLLRAIAGQESGGTANPDQALSVAGAQGRMQLMPDTAKAMGVTNTADAQQNIYGGAKYLSQMLDKYGSPELALAAYNAGPGRLDAYLAGAALPAETQAYVPGVTKRYQALAAARQKATASTSAATPAPQDAFTAALAGSDTATPSAVAQQSAPAAASASPAASAVAQDDDPFTTALGGSDPTATAAPAAPVDYAKFGPLASDVADAQLAVQQKASDAKPLGDQIQDYIAPAPNTTYGSVLPLAADNTTGDVRLALPSSIRDLARGAYDLIQGPSTGTVTPAATGALMAVAGGGIGMLRSPAAGTAEAIGNRLLPQGAPGLGRSEAPDFIGSELRANPGNIQGNRLLGAPPAADSAAQSAAGAAADDPYTSGPTGGMGGSGPRSVGAAASSSADAQLTPAQVQAYRSTAEGQKLLEPQGLARDASAYVPGVQPNAAEIEQSVNNARELKTLGATSPQVSAEAKAIQEQNNDARMDFFSRLAGSDVDIANAKAARSAQAETDLNAAWANKTVADTQPILDTASQIIQSPDGKRPVVRNAIDSVVKELNDSDGNPETDPEVLYGVRKHIDDLMSSQANAANPINIRAQANLQALKDQLDNVIEGAAPGFRQYLDNFSNASRPIDAMQGLQGFENKLVDSKNNMQYSRVQNMMRQVVDSRAAPGINPYKSIPDDTMQQLWNLRDDLRRSASAADLARAPGSDTSQNLMDMVRFGGNAALQAGVNAVAPGIGSLALAGAKNAFAPIMAARAARQQTARGLELLRPTTELQNRLLDGP